MTKPCRIHWIATGGTIAGSGVAGKSSGYQSANLDVEQLMRAVPELKSIAEWSFSQPMALASQNLMLSDWLTLTKHVNAALADESVDAIVVTHGTDSLEETAFWLHLALAPLVQDKKPVILTAAMRPATALSADGPGNIYQAAVFATYLAANSTSVDFNSSQRVWAVLQNRVYAPPMLKKMNGLAPDAFGDADAVAYMLDNCVMWRGSPISGHWPAGRFSHTVHALIEGAAEQADAWPEVVLIKCHVDMNSKRVAQMLTPWPAGIVIEGFGHGTIPKALYGLLEAALAESVVLVRSSRTPYGPVFDVTEADEIGHRAHSAGLLNAVQARIALQLSIATGTQWPEG